MASGWAYSQRHTACRPARRRRSRRSPTGRRAPPSPPPPPGRCRPSTSRSRLLEDEGERLGEGVVGHAGEHPVVDAVEREHLLDVVAQLVDGDVVSPCSSCPSAATRVRRWALSSRRTAPMAWPAPRDGSTTMRVGEPGGLLAREAERGEDCAAGRPGTPPRSGYRAATMRSSSASVGRPRRLEAGVPDVERLQRAAEAAARSARRCPAPRREASTETAAPRPPSRGIWRSSSKARAMEVGAVGV